MKAKGIVFGYNAKKVFQSKKVLSKINCKWVEKVDLYCYKLI